MQKLANSTACTTISESKIKSLIDKAYDLADRQQMIMDRIKGCNSRLDGAEPEDDRKDGSEKAIEGSINELNNILDRISLYIEMSTGQIARLETLV